MFFSFAFCTFFKIFHVRLGKKSKSLSFSRVYVCVKAKLTLVSFFYFFFHAPFPYFGIIKHLNKHIYSPQKFKICRFICKTKDFAWSHYNFREDTKNVKFSIYCKTKLAKFVMNYIDDFDHNWPELVIWRELTILTRSTIPLCWVRRVRYFCAPSSCFARPHRHCGEVGNIVNIQFPFLLSNTNIQYIGFPQKRDFQNAAVFLRHPVQEHKRCFDQNPHNLQV